MASSPLDIEIAAIEGIRDFDGYKEYAKAHARADWERHDEIMETLKPISDAFRTASGVKKVLIAAAIVIGFIISTTLGIEKLARFLWPQ